MLCGSHGIASSSRRNNLDPCHGIAPLRMLAYCLSLVRLVIMYSMVEIPTGATLPLVSPQDWGGEWW
jgi:hypothetical protein